MTANTTQHTGLFKTRYDPRGVDRARRSFNSLKTTGAGLARSLGGVYLAYLAIGKVADTVSKLQNAENLLRTATVSATELSRVQNELLEISHRRRVSYFALADGFKRYSAAAERAGLSTDELLRFTDGLAAVMTTSGRTTQETAAAQIQLGQALGKGYLDGDEFKGLMENMTPIMKVFAKAMGVALGDLKELGSQGLITSDIMFGAFLNDTKDIESGFKKVTNTISQAWGQIGTQASRAMTIIEEKTHVFDFVAMKIARAARYLKAFNDLLSGDDSAEIALNDLAAAKEALAIARQKYAADTENKYALGELIEAQEYYNNVIESMPRDAIEAELATLRAELAEVDGIIADGKANVERDLEHGKNVSAAITEWGRREVQRAGIANSISRLTGALASMPVEVAKSSAAATKTATTSTIGMLDDGEKKARAMLLKTSKYQQSRIDIITTGMQRAEQIQTQFEIESLQHSGRTRDAALAELELSFATELEMIGKLKAAGVDVSELMAQFYARREELIARTQSLPEVDPNIALRNVYGFSSDDISDFTSRAEEAAQLVGFGDVENDPQARFEMEMEAEAARHETAMEILRAQLEEKLLTEQEYNERMMAEKALHAHNDLALQKEQAKTKADYDKQMYNAQAAVYKSLGDLFGVFAGKSKAAAIASLLISKGLAAADVVVSTQMATMKAFAQFGPVLGAPLAAKMQLAGAISLAAIAASAITGTAGILSRGSSSSSTASSTATSAGGSSTVPTAVAEIPEKKEVNIRIDTHGRSVFDSEDIRMLAKELVENYGDAIEVRAEVV